MAKAYAVGVDIGGTKTNIGLIAENGDIAAEHTFPTNPADQAVIERVADGIEHLLCRMEDRVSFEEIRGIGIGSTGQIDFQRGSVHFATDFMPGYTGTPIRQMVQEKFKMPVHVDNDVNVMALTEKYFGVGKHAEHFLCLALGTGIARMMNEQIRCSMDDGASAAHPEPVTARETVIRWQNGDAGAGAVMEQSFKALSSALSSLIHAFNPQAIAIGGGLSEIEI